MCFKSRLEMLRIRVGLLILHRLHLWSAFSSQCWKMKALLFSSLLSSLPEKEKLYVAQKKNNNPHQPWDGKATYVIFPCVTNFSTWWVSNPVVHKAPALTATRVKSTFRPPPANKTCLKKHSNQSDHAMRRQETVSLLHWMSALVLKEQHF